MSRKRGVREYERDNSNSRSESEEPAEVKEIKKTEIKKMTAKEREKIANELDKVIGSRNLVVFNEKLEKIKKLPLRKIYSLDLNEQPYIIAIDGTATPKIIDLCESIGCSNLIATNFVTTNTNINLVSL